MKILTRHIAVAAIVAGAMGVAPADAQNANFTPGDLVLFFQNPGGAVGSDRTVMVSLGNTATVFRDATSNLINLANIGSLLSDPLNGFGAMWWEAPTLYMGLAGVWGNSALGTGLQNGDPQRTLYVSRPRNGVGTVGSADSNAWTILGDTDMTSGANGMIALQNVLETQFTTAAASSGTGQSQVDNQNPFTAPGIQGSAFGIFAGGVQDQFGPGFFGNIAGINAEAALDINRILARNNIAGQTGGAVRQGTYEGTLIIDQAGGVSLIAVPEPSAAALLGLGAVLASAARRRKSVG